MGEAYSMQGSDDECIQEFYRDAESERLLLGCTRI
jgi:hypothetical protein